jgi:replicative DNA helicase
VQQVSARLLSLASDVAAKEFRTGITDEHWPSVEHAMVGTAALPLWIFDRGAPTIVECVRVARRWKQRHEIGALFVDYLQRVEGEGERKLDQVGNVIRGFKNLARDLDIPVIVLAQVSRQVEQRRPPIPRMGDLSDSSEIEKEADQVLMLYREEVYNAESTKRGVARIIVEKNRHGPTGYIECAFHAETMRFADFKPVDPIWGDAA